MAERTRVEWLVVCSNGHETNVANAMDGLALANRLSAEGRSPQCDGTHRVIKRTITEEDVTMPDHPTATPREVFGNPEQLPAPTMAESIQHVEDVIREHTRAGSHECAAHYRNAIAAMRAVSGEPYVVEVRGRDGWSHVMVPEDAERWRGLTADDHRLRAPYTLTPLYAFPTPPARDV